MMTEKIIETKVQKRFSDIDVFRHVNNIHQQEYLDLGKTDYYNQVIGFDVVFDRVVLMIVSIKTDFLGQIRLSEPIWVKTWIKSVGTKSVTVAQQLVCRREDGTDEVRTASETVLVAFDRDAQQTVEVPQEWRDKIGEK